MVHPKTALDMLLDQWREQDPQRHEQWSAARVVLFTNGATLPSLTLVFSTKDRAIANRVRADQRALASATLATGVIVAVEVADDTAAKPPPSTTFVLRRDDRGLDEVIARGVDVHFEVMATNHLWCCLTAPDGKTLHINIVADKGRIAWRAEPDV